MTIARRDLLTTFFFIPLIGRGIRAQDAVRDLQKLDISSLNIRVPQWLLADDADKTGGVRAIAVWKQGDRNIVVEFEYGQTLVVESGSSVASLQDSGGRPSKQSILLKRTLSYLLDAVFTDIAKKRDPAKGVALRRQFEGFQTESIIEVITVGAMYELLLHLNCLDVVSSVSWDAQAGEFSVLGETTASPSPP